MQEQKKIDQIHRKDARKLNEILSEKVVDVTITSPPYFDLKDYGYKGQIGYGQQYSQYLEDLQLVFRNVYNCTKDSGTLWVIIDSFRRNNEVIPLPFDFSNALKEVGWKLQEVIIWAKDRTVPWAHQGQMRNLFEYILLFSKTNKYNFFIDEVRDFSSLKKWWVKYPERYNPKGKIPDGLWHFDIPTQGSWGSGYVKHFCPLPEELIGQILKISTREGDLVLDPFAGSGAVLAKAANMNRNYVGFELNASYISMFKKYLKETGKEKKERYLAQSSISISQSQFEELVIDLRALKFAKILLQKLPKVISKDIGKIFVERKGEKTTQKKAVCMVSYIVYVKNNADEEMLYQSLCDIMSSPPLSKFGVQAVFLFRNNPDEFIKSIPSKGYLYTYTDKITHKFKNQITVKGIFNANKSEIIVSNIKVELNEKDYE